MDDRSIAIVLPWKIWDAVLSAGDCGLLSLDSKPQHLAIAGLGVMERILEDQK